ncbi:CPBP family intramembrane glutamic endopeptidase [Cyanobacterium sp. uoEpiScrs1]|uniref:CPBP family intramembrane glutamic endopeptidase n=1 Tax=Cyanobacterium sp. uoEpiScrs1 TaxID=2976343 RepID=UPI002269FD5E|nr:CPBP family intramembrane glutamic endopeptidase [Cyanobacterium sp. uoEpiScrs1]
MKPNLTRISYYPAPIRIGIFAFILLLLWIPVTIPVHLIFGSNQNLTTVVNIVFLYLEFIGLLFIWNRKVYHNFYWWKQYGLVLTKKNGLELLQGLGLGLGFTVSLFIIESILGWVNFSIPSLRIVKVVIEGLLSALGIAFAEELLFRGWLLEELKFDYISSTVLWVNSLLFAGLHFIKPLAEIIRTFPQFPALLFLGLILVWAKRGNENRLGICIGLHGGFVWGFYILNVGQLLDYTEKISPWITGIDNNPLAGVMGLLFFGVLGFYMRIKANIK